MKLPQGRSSLFNHLCSKVAVSVDISLFCSPSQRHPEASPLQKSHHTQRLQSLWEPDPNTTFEDTTAERKGCEGGTSLFIPGKAKY